MASTKTKKQVKSKVGIQAPWITHYNKVKALLGEDPELEISQFDDESCSFTISSDNYYKIDALSRLLQLEVEYGNVTLTINLEYSTEDEPNKDDFIEAFKGNPNVVDIMTVEGPAGEDHNFVLFKKEVVQFYNDNVFQDPYGNFNGLLSDVARDVINPTEQVMMSIAKD